MNNLDRQYTDLLKTILEHGVVKKDRTGTGTQSIFGYTIRHNMKDGFPLLTTKKMPFRSIVAELLWFLRGETNIKHLLENKCYIWTGDAIKNYRKKEAARTEKSGQTWIDYTEKEFEQKILEDESFAEKWGDLGPIYGKQWRNWRNLKRIDDFEYTPSLDGPIDQIENLINDLKTNPDSRRLMVNAWNVSELDQMVLPPCHYGFQIYTRELSLEERMEYYYTNILKNKDLEEKARTHIDEQKIQYLQVASVGNNIPTRAISLMWNQRSVDTFLGLPFNIASYGLLLEIIAKEVNMIPDQLIGNLGDTHLYLNHLDQAREQIGRELELLERVKIGSERSIWRLGQTVNYMHCDEAGIPKRTREPFPLPSISINMESWHDGDDQEATYMDKLTHSMKIEDFQLENYLSHPAIKAPLSN